METDKAGHLKLNRRENKMINVTLKIKKNDGEYMVQWIENGVIDEGKTYYTDCKQDAIETRDAIIEAYSKTDYTNVSFKI